ncbi:hypothetical protein ACJX0J_014641 [Zea mays]
MDIETNIRMFSSDIIEGPAAAFLPKDHLKPKPDSTMEYMTKIIRSANCSIGALANMFIETCMIQENLHANNFAPKIQQLNLLIIFLSSLVMHAPIIVGFIC